MTKKAYTTDPWMVNGDVRMKLCIHVNNASVKFNYDHVTYKGVPITREIALANAKRAVECVNACMDIEDVQAHLDTHKYTQQDLFHMYMQGHALRTLSELGIEKKPKTVDDITEAFQNALAVLKKDRDESKTA